MYIYIICHAAIAFDLFINFMCCRQQHKTERINRLGFKPMENKNHHFSSPSTLY